MCKKMFKGPFVLFAVFCDETFLNLNKRRTGQSTIIR
jgi:hypothetical protein